MDVVRETGDLGERLSGVWWMTQERREVVEEARGLRQSQRSIFDEWPMPVCLLILCSSDRSWP